MSKVIGIDLGTTNSAVAVLEGGSPTIITNAEGQRTTPSIVAESKEGERLVGEMAKRQAVTNPDNTIKSIKRHMGTEHTARMGDKEYTPQEISAMILRKLKEDAESFLGEEVERAVITVPAYFTDAQRQATKDAGKIAGLEVLRIINEPTAASLAYGLDESDDQLVLVYDLGGGTFDVSLLELGDGVFEVRATSGNNRLGGDDFDEAIMDWILERFEEDTGVDLSSDRAALQRIREAAEKAKIELSSVKSTNINLPYITMGDDGPLHIDYDLTRAEFERMIDPLIEKTVGPTKRALSDAEIGPEDVDRVILVGGSTRVPAVQEAIKKIVNKEPDKSVNPDECVALGAAIQAGVLAGEIDDIVLLDVTPLSLGIETLGGVFTKLIDRNTTIPTQKSKVFSTAADGQTSVEIHVLQGEREMAQDNVSLGRFHLTGIPPAPRGVPQIEVTFDIDANGIVNVSAEDKGTGKKQDITITGTTALSDEEIEQMINEAEEHAEEDKRRREAIEARNNAESLVYSAEKTLDELGDKVDSEIREKVEAKIEEVQEALEGDDTTEIKRKTEELSEVIQEIGSSIYQQQAQQGADGFTGAGPDGFTGAGQGQQQAQADGFEAEDADFEVKE